MRVRAFDQHNEKAKQLRAMYHGPEYALLTDHHAYQVRSLPIDLDEVFNLFEGLHAWMMQLQSLPYETE